MEGNITITKLEYLSLRICAEKLSMLDMGGVDNWDYYGDCLWPEDGDTIDDIKEQLEKEISEK